MTYRQKYEKTYSSLENKNQNVNEIFFDHGKQDKIKKENEQSTEHPVES